MVDTANHPNINLLTYSEIVQIEGKAGDFKVTVRKKPRFVETAKCTGCGDCAAQCPVTLPNEFDMGLGMRKGNLYPLPSSRSTQIYDRSPRNFPLHRHLSSPL